MGKQLQVSWQTYQTTKSAPESRIAEMRTPQALIQGICSIIISEPACDERGKGAARGITGGLA
jgi:hypothetical protein